MRSELRRPPRPDLTDWTSRMEAELVARVRPAPPVRTRPQIMQRLVRLVRSIARPAGHGIAAFTASLVVITSLSVPTPVGSPTPTPTVVPTPVVDDPVSVPAQSVGFLTLLPPDDAQAVRRSDIQSARSALTEAPQSDAPAVPTPDGGGWADATLRPTVR